MEALAQQDYSIFLPNYTIGTKPYARIAEICSAYGKQAVVIGGKRAMQAAGEKLRSASEGAVALTGFLWYGGECCETQIARLCSAEAVREADMVFAVGGGKATDTAKAVAEKLGKPVFAFPTIASNCSACTGVSILYQEDGSFLKPYFLKRPPLHTFIDLEILSAAPERYLWAGIGDTYAKYYESTISARGDKLKHYEALGVLISKMCLEPLLENGRQALDDNKAGVVSEAFRDTVLAVIVSTALTSILVTQDRIIDYNTGLAHAIFYALTAYPEIEAKHLHGELVAFGVLLLLLVDGQEEEFKRLYAFNESIGLPTKLSDTGVSKAQTAEIQERALRAPDIAHNPYKITPEKLQKAFDALEAYRSADVRADG